MTELVLLVGGAIGGVLRLLVEQVMPTPDQFPLGTLCINLGGSLVLGFFYALADRRNISPLFRSAFGTGVIGAFTTFSTFVLETTDLVEIHWWMAVVYGIGSLFGGLVCAAGGERLAVWLLERPLTEGRAR
ncbi:MAG: fluoride efflux transporter CrcB [Alicyclobacillus sp.]|nr:fluoride efflux transporter CrcB [Alicyclobacillus sp.]